MPTFTNFTPQGGMIPLIVNGQMQDNVTAGNSINDLNQSILQRVRRARAQGMNENDIQANVAQDLAEQSDARQQLANASSSFTNQSQQSKKKSGNWLTHLIPTLTGTGGAVAGAAAGTAILPGIGTVIGGILGGALGSAGGKVGENAAEGNGLTQGVGGEALLGGLGGLIPGGKLISSAGRGGVNLLERGAASTAERAALPAGEQAITGAVGDSADAGVNRIVRMGDELRSDARGMNQAGKIFPSQTERNTASNVMDSVGLKGSARNQFRNIDAAIGNLNTKANAILESNTGRTNALDVAQRFVQGAAGDTEATRPAFQDAMNRLTDNLLNRADQQTGQLSAKDLYAFKQDVGNQLDSAWKKLQNGTTLSPSEKAYLSVWKNVDNEITQMAPEAKSLTRAQSILMESRPVLDKAQNPTTKLFNVVPVSAPTQMLQAAEGGAGRVLQRIGGKAGANAGKSLPRVVAGQAARQTLPRLLLGGYQDTSGADGANADPNAQASQAGLSLFSNPEEAQAFSDQLQQAGVDTNAVSQRLLGGTAGAGSVSAGQDGSLSNADGTAWDSENGNGSIPRSAIQKALQDDLASTGGKNFNAILTFADYANQTGDYAPQQDSGSQLSADNQKTLLGLQQASNTIDQVESLYNAAGGGKGKLGGTLEGFFGKASGNAANTYNQQVGGFAAQISRALGNTGAMSDQDVARAVGLLPKITDTPSQAQAKLNSLRQLLAANSQSVLSTAGGSSSAAGVQ